MSCYTSRNPTLVQSHGVNKRSRGLSNLAAPEPDDAEKQYPEHIKRIVEDISKLTILEVSELNQLLKTTLKIEDVPMMAMGAMAPGPAKEGETEEPEKAPEPTEFTVKLAGFDDTAKVKLIKEIKNLIPGMNLVQAKKFVESVPQIVREKTNKEEAETVKKALEAAGATVEIES
ncbi:39S ribosomal protein L12, mitochondrial-like [Actinia tenebrosa]|uniref:39S ribosomal protein L12, mitochondrial-like n=1 Tax=Actinia tenebrosa TaxID=6105 RepID=A0A6P8IX02_ACTTE|nr:39S ribosomal protein L12, mitochondrial-like [Actinia tenebrosa]